MLLKNIIYVLKSQGLIGLFANIYQRIFPQRAACFSLCENLLNNKSGLEIGGPSGVFKKVGILPLYGIVANLDNCNFSGMTTWEGQIIEGRTFRFRKDKPLGYQYLTEATDLSGIDSSKYDFVLSSHMLEHTANPLLAIYEWIRVLKDDGIFVILVPHKDATFDHRRPITTLEHIVEDYNCNVKEDDLTHLSEILELHDLEKDPGAGTFESFKARSEDNINNRCFHHHVFNTQLAVQILDYMNLQIQYVEAILPQHIVIVAKKMSSNQTPDNTIFLSDGATYKSASPFHSDRNIQLNQIQN
jgi:SAM-dependent methyltransferase